MSDRLKDLQRQRTLVEEQLAWLNREIAKETGQGPAASQPPAATGQAFAPAFGVHSAQKAEAARLADEILIRYKTEGGDPDLTQRNVKRGCLLYFGLAMLLLAAAVAGLYFYSRSHH